MAEKLTKQFATLLLEKRNWPGKHKIKIIYDMTIIASTEAKVQAGINSRTLSK